MATDYDAMLQKAKQGDRQALTAIYDAFYTPLYRYVYRQVEGEETARDLTADVFHRLLQAIQKETGPDQYLQAWLYRVAHNTIVDHYRRMQYRDHLPLLEQMASAEDDPIRLAEANIAAAQVRQSMRQLTPDQQQVIALKFFAGLSNQEIALTIAKPIGAVKALQHRAIAALQRQLVPVEEELTV